MNILQRIKDGAGRATERAQSAVEIGRLNSHISDIQREIDVHFLRMGQVFYENYSNRNTAPAEEEIMELCTVCDQLNEEIAELRIRIAKLRSEQLCVCGARLEADAVSCPHCGRELSSGEQAKTGGEAPTVSTKPAAASAKPPVRSEERVELRKESTVQTEVEAEAVHNLVDDPDFGREDWAYEDERGEEAFGKDQSLEEMQERYAESETERYRNNRRYEVQPEEERHQDSVRYDVQPQSEDEYADEQFETKRFELGSAEQHELESNRDAAQYEEDADQYSDSVQDREEEKSYGSSEASLRGDEETLEQREERQRRELREIRARERSKLKEAQSGAEPRAAAEPQTQTVHEEEQRPAHDPEYERRQRERIEREKERQDELDRLIASWNRGTEIGSEEELIIRRPVGEVVRCQVCGSGLPKGSKWCPHCASEQI
ncbi:hypothetical protein [Saccharibacillus kuerlensis]|uniref:Zinc ribbon domain-containing protein n=1 Tax=Saccharibacillus kuerlensis TaxID=459527 RepID=A0ABQ2L1N4_9BACL|nr:hypothetical protein [Saccharibacillus kuerlensis]GGN99663.1 hypothetical protein GCM10010969_19950 [Saccharibacillus kuerlensis]